MEYRGFFFISLAVYECNSFSTSDEDNVKSKISIWIKVLADFVHIQVAVMLEQILYYKKYG